MIFYVVGDFFILGAVLISYNWGEPECESHKRVLQCLQYMYGGGGGTSSMSAMCAKYFMYSIVL